MAWISLEWFKIKQIVSQADEIIHQTTRKQPVNYTTNLQPLSQMTNYYHFNLNLILIVSDVNTK